MSTVHRTHITEHYRRDGRWVQYTVHTVQNMIEAMGDEYSTQSTHSTQYRTLKQRWEMSTVHRTHSTEHDRRDDTHSTEHYRGEWNVQYCREETIEIIPTTFE